MTTTIQHLEASENIDKSFDASDKEQVNEARKKSGRKKVKERETLQALMMYENGRKLMFDSIKCILTGSPVVAQDTYSTFFNLGQEHRARHLFKEIVQVSPKEFVLMIEENKDEL